LGGDMMQIGIVGLPNVGKSTLFNALTNDNAGAENYPFCTIDPNIGVVKVPDKRLKILNNMFQPEEKTPTTIKFVDIAGLVKGASKGEGLGNKFLANIREVDAIAHVIRCFKDKDIAHINGSLDPIRDIEVIDTELIMSDLSILTNRRKKTKRMLKTGEKKYQEEIKIIDKLIELLERGNNIREVDLNRPANDLIEELELLTAKPVIYIANITEKVLNENSPPILEKVKEYAKIKNITVVPISASIEEELSGMKSDEKDFFLKELGLEEVGLDLIIKKSYDLLGLITLYTTTGGKEVRATTVKKNTRAPVAAGKIHSDMEKGFIKAEVIDFNDLHKVGSLKQAGNKGLLRIEGKDYIIKDGDVCYFHFNV
jgi:GTP-binding protein YchF